MTFGLAILFSLTTLAGLIWRHGLAHSWLDLPESGVAPTITKIECVSMFPDDDGNLVERPVANPGVARCK